MTSQISLRTSDQGIEIQALSLVPTPPAEAEVIQPAEMPKRSSRQGRGLGKTQLANAIKRKNVAGILKALRAIIASDEDGEAWSSFMTVLRDPRLEPFRPELAISFKKEGVLGDKDLLELEWEHYSWTSHWARQRIQGRKSRGKLRSGKSRHKVRPLGTHQSLGYCK